MEKFKNLVEALKNSGIKCNIKLFKNDNIVVECGWNYPDELFFQVLEAAESLGIQADVEVCAETSGGELLAQERINGGPRRY